jgi:hypothetical protein
MLAAGVAAGLLLGVGSRGVMRWIALEAGMTGAYSRGGSVEVVIFGALVGFPIAVAFWAIRHRIPWPRPLAGLAVGLGAVAVFALVPPPSARSALAGTPDTPGYTLAAFAVLFGGWGLALDLVSHWVRAADGRQAPPPPSPAGR